MTELLATRLTLEHQAAVLKLEAEEMKRLRMLYIAARRELLGRLSEMHVETFTAQQYRATLAQVEAGLDSMRAKLGVLHGGIVDRALPLGSRQMLDEVEHFEGLRGFDGGATGRIQFDALRRISDVRGLLIQQCATSISRYGLDVIGDVQRRLGVHLVKRSKWTDVAQDIAGRLEASAVQGAQWKAERIVRTELHNALNAGHQAGLEAAQAVLPDLGQQWNASLDARVCPRCRRLNGKIVPVGKPFVLDGVEITRPPLHPNDRCRTSPWRKAWAEGLDAPDPPRESKPAPTKTAAKRAATDARRRERTLQAEEAAIRLQRVEHAALVSPKGDVLWRHTSHARSYVSFTPDHVRSMRGNALTHNHPSGRSLSVEDISLAMRVGLSEIRAVGSTGYTYSMRPKKGRPWSESFLVNTLGPALQRIGPVVQRELERMILARQITPDEANFRLWHDIWTRVSREIGVHYTRRRHG